MPDTIPPTLTSPSSAGTPTSTTATPAPPSQKPRVWLITSVLSPLGFALAQEILRLGDKLVGGCCREEFEVERVRHVCRYGATNDSDVKIITLKELGGERVHFVELDVRSALHPSIQTT